MQVQCGFYCTQSDSEGIGIVQTREKFSSRLGFILISAGCAIGLGNVYRFPIWCGAYGGGFFLLFYLIFLVLLGIPVMTAEYAVGRGSQRSIANSFDVLEKKGQKWHLMKYLGVAGNYLLMMFYTCITGWFMVYFWKYLTGSISTVTAGMTVNEGSAALGAMFGGIATNFGLNVGVTAIVVVLGFTICAMGLQNGVEKITKSMMVALFALIIGLVIYAFTMSGMKEGLSFYLIPNAERLEYYGIGKVISAAMSQAFFTLSLGIGSIAIFGSYIGRDRSLLGETFTVVGLDTFIALMSGLLLFPAFFTFNPGATTVVEEPGTVGASFLFTTISSIFNSMPGGRFIGTLFFLFMVFAAMSTVVAVFENIMSFWMEWTKLKRWQIAVINVVLMMVLVLPFIVGNCFGDSIFGKSIWLAASSPARGRLSNFGDFEDFLVSNVALPVGSLVYILFCTSKFGWGWKNYEAEVNAGEGAKVPKWMRPYLSYVLPVIIFVVLIMSVA